MGVKAVVASAAAAAAGTAGTAAGNGEECGGGPWTSNSEWASERRARILLIDDCVADGASHERRRRELRESFGWHASSSLSP